MQCTEFESYLEQHSGEPFQPAAAAHLDVCANCRSLIADFDVIETSAAALGAETPEPPERIWVSLRAALLSEGLIREPEPEHAGFLALLTNWLPRPALAGAYVAILLAAAVLIGLRGNLGTLYNTASTLNGLEIAAVKETLRSAETNTPPVVAARHPDVTSILQKDMALVDNFIAMCEKHVREEPQNTLAREYLFGAYQQKADLLATIADRGARGD